MVYTIFDVETTGFSGARNDVCQFAYITVDDKLEPVRADNLYFYREGMDWGEEAAAVHGLTREFLKQYEGQYEQNLLHMYTVLQHGALVGHNADGFDIPFTNQYLVRHGFPAMTPLVSYDTMRLFNRTLGRTKLVNLPGMLGIQSIRIGAMARKAFRGKVGELRPHDACYDVAATLLCFREAVKQGLCVLQSPTDTTTASAPRPALSM